MIVLKDKGKNSKIYIPRTKITNVTGGNNTTDLTDYYTKEEVDELIENVEVDLSDYYTKEEIDEIVENTTIPYLVVNDDFTGYESGDFESVRQAIINKKPFSIYIPSVLGGYLTPNSVDTFGGQITLTYVYHTNGTTMYYGICYLHSDSVRNTVESVGYATSEQLAKQGVYSLILYYDEALGEYTFSGVSFSSIYSRIENKEKQYAIYLPSSDNKYMVEAQEIVIDGDVIKCKTIENNGTTQTITNWTIGEDEEGFEYYRKGTTSTINIATQEWIEQQGFLTSIPDDVVTEDELNEALENIDMSYPTLIINLANSTYEGDLDKVVAAIKNDEPVNVIMRKNNNTVYLATQYYVTSTYFRCYCRYWLSVGRLEETYVQITFATNEVKKTTRETIGVVDELTSTDATSALSANQGRVLNETKQDTLVSGTNIKTINGNSLLGSGDIVVEGGGSSNIVELTQAEYDALGDNVDTDTLYLISDATISANYKTVNGESILGEGNIEIGGSESVAYLIIKENPSENTYSYIGGSFEDVVNAYNNNKPYFIYVPNGAGVGYYSLAETTIITDTYIQCLSFAHTGVTHTWRYWRLYSDSPTLYNQTTYEYATVSQVNAINTQIGDINNILENIIG